MTQTSPGPVADHAFRLGIIAAAIAGIAVLGLAYWVTDAAPFLFGYAMVVLFPVYLVLAAAVLSVWLGFDKDARALRRVSREQESN